MIKTIFLTGASGIMGHQTLKELLNLGEKVYLKLLVLKSDKDFIKKYKDYKNIEIIEGDLRNYEDVLKGVSGADYVLHIGGMVSPVCDERPKLTKSVNVSAAENIVKAVLNQKNRDNIKVCYIGSVAELGDRNFPVHWGRTGDPIKISVYDHYALSKVIAERIIVESGIKHWVVMRQTGILYPGLMWNLRPIIYNVCINGALEWATVEDSGRLMKNLVEYELPKDFWNKFYNIGSGEEYRMTNFEFENAIFNSLGFGSPKMYFEPNWFISRNFHGHYFSDSDNLENILHFRNNIPFQTYMKDLVSKSSLIFRLFKHFPFKRLVGLLVKPYFKLIANTPYLGTLYWIKHRDNQKITAYFGSLEEYEKIPKKWSEFKLDYYETNTASGEKYKLSHGYDENKKLTELDLKDCEDAAIFRGGKLLSKDMTKGDLSTKLTWECGYCKKVFKASPALILLGGHWCPNCYVPEEKWDYDGIAKNNKFFAQVYYHNHRQEEYNIYYYKDLFSSKVYNEEKKDYYKEYMITNISGSFFIFIIICFALKLCSSFLNNLIYLK